MWGSIWQEVIVAILLYYNVHHTVRENKGASHFSTSDEDVSIQTFSTVFHMLSIVASVLLYICSWAECLRDIEGNNDRSKTLVYGPVQVVVEVYGYVIKFLLIIVWGVGLPCGAWSSSFQPSSSIALVSIGCSRSQCEAQRYLLDAPLVRPHKGHQVPPSLL